MTETAARPSEAVSEALSVPRETLVEALRRDPDRWLPRVTDSNLRALATPLDDAAFAIARRMVENYEAWRANPATFAAQITAGDVKPYQLWPHALLMARTMARAASGEHPHQIHMLASQYGKGLDLTTPIATPTGWTTMGDLRRGDVIFGGDGKPCSVVDAMEPRLLDCYRVEFHDGANLIADGDHLWRVHDSHTWRVLDTRTIARNPSLYRVPRCPGLETGEVELPVDPYVLGVWLGDGHSASARLTSADTEIADHLWAAGCPVRKSASSRYLWTWAGTGLQKQLRRLGVLGNKHVPTIYLRSGDKQRLSLLQGLMDTDGSVSPNQSGYSQCEFTSTRRELAEAVEFLARSLGIAAKTSEGRATLDGRDRGPKWRVTFTTDLPVFRLSRKAARLYDVPGIRRSRSRVGFKSVTLVESRPTRCIRVDSCDQTFLAGEKLTVTHNSTALKWFIIWLLDRDPTLRIMYVSYSHEKAVEFGGEVRDAIRRYAPHLRFRIRADKRARGLWSTHEGGGLYCTGIDGTITGIPIDVVLCDDLFKGWEAAHSAAQREHVWNVYVAQVRMRVQSFDNPIIHAGTRWHEDDIPARLMARASSDPFADQWLVVRLPTFAEAPQVESTDPLLRLPDPLGREVDDLICPERFDLRETMARRAGLASYLWAAMEQQRPAPLEGNIFKRDWWRLDFEDAFSGTADQWITSWDMKLKQKRTGDFVVGQVWARTGRDLWLVDMLRGQWDQPTTENAVALAMVRYPQVSRHVMENTGNGPEVMDSLRRAHPGYDVSDAIAGSLGMTGSEREDVATLRRRGLAGIIPHNPRGDKTVRALAVSGSVEAGDVHICKSKPWFGTFMDEMSNFSGHNDIHDDIVDALTQAVKRLQRVGRGVRTSGMEQRIVRAGA